jgi:hypothetical protein
MNNKGLATTGCRFSHFSQGFRANRRWIACATSRVSLDPAFNPGCKRCDRINCICRDIGYACNPSPLFRYTIFACIITSLMIESRPNREESFQLWVGKASRFFCALSSVVYSWNARRLQPWCFRWWLGVLDEWLDIHLLVFA